MNISGEGLPWETSADVSTWDMLLKIWRGVAGDEGGCNTDREGGGGGGGNAHRDVLRASPQPRRVTTKSQLPWEYRVS